MASARYTRYIQENPEPEEKRVYTRKEKLQTHWLYHKWYYIGGAFAAALIISFIVSIATKIDPDYTIGIIGSSALPDSTATRLADNLEPFVTDRNGDGNVVVYINQYSVSIGDDDTPVDPNMQMANMTRLMGDLQTCESMIFLTNDLEGVQTSQQIFGYNDLSFPNEGEEVDFSKMGVKWSDCPTLMALDLGQIEIFGVEEGTKMPEAQDIMKNYTIVLRAFDGSDKNSKQALYQQASFELFNKLTAK